MEPCVEVGMEPCVWGRRSGAQGVPQPEVAQEGHRGHYRGPSGTVEEHTGPRSWGP